MTQTEGLVMILFFFILHANVSMPISRHDRLLPPRVTRNNNLFIDEEEVDDILSALKRRTLRSPIWRAN